MEFGPTKIFKKKKRKKDFSNSCFIFRNATQELIKRGAKVDVYCDYVKSEFRAFLGQLPKKKGQHYAFEKQYLQSYKNEQPMSMCFFNLATNTALI